MKRNIIKIQEKILFTDDLMTILSVKINTVMAIEIFEKWNHFYVSCHLI